MDTAELNVLLELSPWNIFGEYCRQHVSETENTITIIYTGQQLTGCFQLGMLTHKQGETYIQ